MHGINTVDLMGTAHIACERQAYVEVARTSGKTSTAARGEKGGNTVLVDLGELLRPCLLDLFWLSCSSPPELALLRTSCGSLLLLDCKWAGSPLRARRIERGFCVTGLWAGVGGVGGIAGCWKADWGGRSSP